jgi:hypothetical protein
VRSKSNDYADKVEKNRFNEKNIDNNMNKELFIGNVAN